MLPGAGGSVSNLSALFLYNQFAVFGKYTATNLCEPYIPMQEQNFTPEVIR